MPARSASPAASCGPEVDTLPIAFIHQDLGLVDWMTVAENVAIQTGYPRGAPRPHLMAAGSQGRGATRSPSWEAARSRRARLLASRRRALARRDRPGARGEVRHPRARRADGGAARRGRRAPARALRRLRASGIGIIYVTHRLDEVFRIADRVTVLRDGRRVATVDVGETSPGDLVEKIVGRSMTDAFVRPAPSTDRVVLEVKDAVAEACRARSPSPSRRARRWASSASAAPGTIRSAARSSARSRSRGGHVVLDGQSIDPADPADAMRQRDRLRLEPARRGEHRRQHGGAREHLPEPGGHRQRRLRADRHAGGERRRCAAALKRFSIKAARSRAGVATLCGGNQQKVVVARWMEAKVQAARPRGADDRRRRRLQGRDLSPPATVAAEGAGGASDLVGLRGGRAHLPSRAGLQPRPRRRRNPARTS